MNTLEKPLHSYLFSDLIRLIFKYRKQILISTLLFFFASTIVSFLLPVYYQSTALIFPNNLTLSDKNTIFGQQQGQNEHSYFGNKYDANRILSIANSSVVIGHIIAKYELIKHYKNENKKYKWTETVLEFQKNYNCYKNDRDAIEISILDTDKQLAADMVNEIIYYTDMIATEPIIENKKKIIKMLQKEIEAKENEKKSSIENRQLIEEELKTLRQSLTQYKATANDNISSISILQKAHPAEKKTKPIRWIIVLFSTLAGFVVSVGFALLLEQYNFLKKELKEQKN